MNAASRAVAAAIVWLVAGSLTTVHTIRQDTGRGAAAAPAPRPPADPAPQSAGLKIVVIAGEGAINVIQQKTASAPVVEVRDRNNLPVSGAVVRFAIRNGRATFNGARTLAVTTDAAGRAAVTGLTPTGSGALQVSASAAFQGQTATVTIAQTNVMTAAQAASAAGASGGAASGTAAGATATAGTAAGEAAGAAAAGGAAGTGGGIAASTIAVVGAAVGGGTLVATQVLGNEDHAGQPTTYTGSYSVPVTFSITRLPGHPQGAGSCSDTRVMSGDMSVTLNDPKASTLSGTATTSYTQTRVAGGTCGGSGASTFALPTSPLTGTPASFKFTLNLTTGNGTGTVFDICEVTATLVGDVITATVVYSGGADSAIQQNRGATTFSVELR